MRLYKVTLRSWYSKGVHEQTFEEVRRVVADNATDAIEKAEATIGSEIEDPRPNSTRRLKLTGTDAIAAEVLSEIDVWK